ncbi:MAG TPA: thiamine diphosphokinase [Anaerolineae bacterium]|nr:thiamine diphosphokinase [Anaerolineae bacterium]HNU06106.1 thiamine diphosphokinase [Anaerolineae bacterium]
MRAFVVANSQHSLPPTHRGPQAGDLVLAADGGANLCLAWGWPVDAVVGDMDSITAEARRQLEARGVPFSVWPTAKDETDLELALRLALARGASDLVIAGALGGRIDHTLGNLALLALPSLAHLPTCIADGDQTIWLVRGRMTIAGQPGDTLSLLPFGGDAHGVSVSGVHWPLHEAELPLGPSLSISNRMVASQAEITLRAGLLLAVHIAQASLPTEPGLLP